VQGYGRFISADHCRAALPNSPAAEAGVALTRESSAEQGRRLFESCFLFQSLPPPQRQQILSHAHLRHFEAGETIFLMGAPGNAMMAVLSGEVRISAPSKEGKEIVLTILYPGEVFGEISVLDGGRRTADATAVMRCDIMVLERRDVLHFLEQNPEAYPSIMLLLCEKLRRTTEQVAEIFFLDMQGRLARTLLRLIEQRKAAASANVPLLLRRTQGELANMIGGTRESVNKCLGEWQRRGLIRMKGGTIIIVDKAALGALARGR
jgi:CRP-like cAMP-binding protein